MTRNELRAQLLIEAANLLKQESLNEALFEKNLSSSKKVRDEVNAGLHGKYDKEILDSEEKVEKFLDKYGDDVEEVVRSTKEDLIKSRKFTKGKLITLALGIISFLSAMGAIGIKTKQLKDLKKAREMEFEKKNAELAAKFKQTSDEIDRKWENFEKTREDTLSNISKRHSELNDIISKSKNASKNMSKIDDMNKKTDAIMGNIRKEYDDKIENSIKDTTKEYLDKFNKQSEDRVNKFIDDTTKEIDDLLASFAESVNTESISGAITVALTVTSILSALGVIIDLILRAKDSRDIQENIKYIRMIKRKLTTDLPKIKNKKIADRYKVFIEKINRAEDEFTRRVTVTN